MDTGFFLFPALFHILLKSLEKFNFSSTRFQNHAFLRKTFASISAFRLSAPSMIFKGGFYAIFARNPPFFRICDCDYLSLRNQLTVEQIGCVNEILLVSRRAGQIAKQDLSLIRMLRANETQPQQKAAVFIKRRDRQKHPSYGADRETKQAAKSDAYRHVGFCRRVNCFLKTDGCYFLRVML